METKVRGHPYNPGRGLHPLRLGGWQRSDVPLTARGAGCAGWAASSIPATARMATWKACKEAIKLRHKA